MNEPTSPRNWAEPQRFALLLAAMVFIPFCKVLLGFDTFAVRDWGLFSFPVATFQKECFWRGEWPVWNPYSCCGTPFLAQFNTLALYPLSLLYLLLPLTWSLPAFCLLHVFLGGMGMYFLARRWTDSQAGRRWRGGLLLQRSVAEFSHVAKSHCHVFMGSLGGSAGGGWMAGRRNQDVRGGAGGGDADSGGRTGDDRFHVACSAGAGGGGMRPPTAHILDDGAAAGCDGIAGLGLAAAQLLPTLDLARHSHRDTHFGRSDWSMPLLGWGNFLVPMFNMSPMQQIVVQPGQYWTSSYYAGIGVVFLAGIAMWRGRRNGRVWLLGAFLLGSLVLALGYNGFVFRWVQQLIPVLGVFRFPVKFVILALTVAPLLAAFGVALCERQAPGGWRGWFLEFAWGAAMLALIGVILWAARRWPVEGSSWPATVTNGLWRVLFLVLTVLALYLFVSRPAWRSWSIVPLLAVGWVDVLTHEPWQNPTLDPSLYQPGMAAINAQFNPAPNIAESRLMMSPYSARQLYYQPASDLKVNFLLDRSVFLANCNLLDDLPKVDGFFSLNLRESDKVLWLLDSRTGPATWTAWKICSPFPQTIAPGKVLTGCRGPITSQS
jgi:hypothetical protein